MTRLSARRAVATAIAGYRGEVEAETLRLFRLHLQVTVRHASPVALDVARCGGIDLSERLEQLRLPAMARQPRHLGRAGCQGGTGPPLGHRRSPHATRTATARSLAFADHERAEAPLSFDVILGALQVAGSLGVCSLHTVRSRGRITLPPNMPETLLLAARGRRLDAIVDHPALSGRGYVVRDVVSDLFDNGAALLFDTGLVAFEMPWRDLLQEELAAARRAARGNAAARSTGTDGPEDR